MPSPTPIQSCAAIRIIPVTSVSDLPTLADICDIAFRADPFYAFLTKYGNLNNDNSVYQDQLSKLTAAVLDQECSRVFKAVKPMRNAEGVIEGVVVGVAQWFVGYCVVDKVDPFAPTSIEPEQGGGNGLADGVETGEGAKKLNPWQEVMRKTGNSYVSAIRGKKHVYLRRMMVHPDYQRQGVGRKLMQWGLDTADEQKIVSWLFARPAGRRLYEAVGFVIVATTDIEVNEEEEGVEVEVEPTVSMLRVPRPFEKGV